MIAVPVGYRKRRPISETQRPAVPSGGIAASSYSSRDGKAEFFRTPEGEAPILSGMMRCLREPLRNFARSLRKVFYSAKLRKGAKNRKAFSIFQLPTSIFQLPSSIFQLLTSIFVLPAFRSQHLLLDLSVSDGKIRSAEGSRPVTVGSWQKAMHNPARQQGENADKNSGKWSVDSESRISDFKSQISDLKSQI